jgi:hypothetical protein
VRKRTDMELYKAYRAAFAGVQGAVVLADLAKMCGVFQPPSHHPTNPDATRYYEERRSVWLHVLSRMGIVDIESITRAVLAVASSPPKRRENASKEEGKET